MDAVARSFAQSADSGGRRYTRAAGRRRGRCWRQVLRQQRSSRQRCDRGRALYELRERGIRVPQDISVTRLRQRQAFRFCYPADHRPHSPRPHRSHICDCLLPKSDHLPVVEAEIVFDPEFVRARLHGPGDPQFSSAGMKESAIAVGDFALATPASVSACARL